MSTERIRRQAAELRRILAEAPGDLASVAIPRSSWCAAAQFDHILKVGYSILTILAKPEPDPLPRGINVLGRAILVLGWIPRGIGKSPKRLRGEVATMEELQRHLTSLETVLERVAARTDPPPSAPIVPHPTFGGLTYPQALRFVGIHTHHHLKILQTVLR